MENTTPKLGIIESDPWLEPSIRQRLKGAISMH